MRIKLTLPNTEWHKWFAWHPVLADKKDNGLHWVFLEFVERKWDRTPLEIAACHCWIYRLPSTKYE
jgi:hypothetical protein